MTTELCAYTCDACDIARRTGVTRIELCAAPFEGGTTPSAGLIRYARSLPGLRLSVMIRPRGGDFCYTDAETALMAEEIRFARACGADGVVLGVLTPDGEVDETRTAQLVREAEGMEVTFHRAFDMTRDSRQALAATGVDALHFSARREREGAMRFRNPQVSMGGCAGVPEYSVTDADETLVRKLLAKLE